MQLTKENRELIKNNLQGNHLSLTFGFERDVKEGDIAGLSLYLLGNTDKVSVETGDMLFLIGQGLMSIVEKRPELIMQHAQEFLDAMPIPNTEKTLENLETVEIEGNA